MEKNERWQSLFTTMETKSAKDPTLSNTCILIAVIPDTCTRSLSATSQLRTSELSYSGADAAAKAAAEVAAVVPYHSVIQESIIH